jgi:hypothetical protein
MAAAYAGVGRRDTALALLSGEAPIADLAELLRYQPIFDSIRDDSRFHRIIRDFNRAWGLRPDGSLP